MNSAQPIRLLIADDHYIVRMGLKTVLHLDPGLRVVAEASSADETIAAHAAARPDVTLLDLRMPGSGLEALRRIRSQSPEARVLVLTTSEMEEDIYRALAAGANGYLLKNIPPEELATAIRAVHGGARWVPDVIARKLADRASNPDLSPREAEVLRLVIKGLSNHDVAAALKITHSTAKAHVARILEKLNVATRAEASTEALRRGLVHPDD
jgi:two-component system NarL family response regulator